MVIIMESNETEKMHSKWIFLSYGQGPALNQFFRMAFIAFGFYFYEGEIGLNVWITGLAYIIFAIWNAVNDPLVGWLTDRPFKFTKKWGRRFPWTMIGGVPWVFSYILIFIPPAIDPKAGAWIIFAWLVFSTCLFDTFNSIWWVNFYSLFPDKFRSSKERRIASGFITPVGIIGISLGGLVPPLLIEYGIPSTFVIQAVAVTFIAFIMLMLGIPGWRDDQECVDKYLARCEEETEQTPFFKALLQSFKHRSYVAFLVLYFTWQVLIFCIQATIPYLVNFVLKLKASNQLFMQIAFLVGALVSIYFWIKFAQKTNNNKKVLLIASIMLAAFSIPLSFINNIWAFVVIFIFWGCALGGYWGMERPILSDIIDESVVKTGKREEGMYSSIVMFFNRLAMIFQVLIFAIVHSLTGFEEGGTSQTLEAQAGILMHFGLIPSIFLIVGIFVFWKLYDLEPSRIKENQIRIKELGL